MVSANALLLLLIFFTAGVFGFVPSAVAQSRIDLAVDSVQVNTPRLSKNQKVEITPTIRNNGSEEAENVTLEVDILKEGRRIKAIKDIPVPVHLPRAGSGQALPIGVDGLGQGSYEAVVIIDPDDQIQETNEGNNQKKRSFYVSEPLA